MTRSLRPRDLHAAATRPLQLADEGCFWLGTRRVPSASGTLATGQMYVEYRIPQELTQPYPIVMIHGGGGQGTDYLVTPDGRPGWVSWFLAQGYAVYLVDRHGHGRSPFHPDALGPMTQPLAYEYVQKFFSGARQAAQWPRSALHTQWPGAGTIGDPALDQFMAAAGPMMADSAASHAEMARCGSELLDVIGPAILMTHSAGGPSGWMIADARPGAVRAILAIEPLGPPFSTRGPVSLVWGLTSAPITYDPPAGNPEDLRRKVRQPADSSLVPCEVQAEPARRLPNLCGFPIAVVTAEASWMAHDNHGIVDYLVQAGADAVHLRLENEGVHGNGHAMMLEKNSDEVAEVLHRWLIRNELAAASPVRNLVNSASAKGSVTFP